ncbi:MAG: hypothetical protein ACI9U2_004709 [Bradymonadia bacterium]|jgi:hypothetical protein
MGGAQAPSGQPELNPAAPPAILSAMRFFCFALLTIASVLSASVAQAGPRRVAVLSLKNTAELAPPEVRYIADQVRAGLLRLPPSQFVILTRENILAMLPPGRQLADCEGDCEVETGRNIGADLIITGEVLAFGAGLRVALRAHEVESGKLVATVAASGATIEALERPVVDAARALALRLPAAQPGLQVGVGAPRPPPAPNQPVNDDTGFLVITSQPTGAQVRIDGVAVGVTPQQQELSIGRHRVQVGHALYHPDVRALRIGPTGARLAVVLRPAHGALRVEGERHLAGAQVRLNGEPVGRVPWAATQKASGDYVLTVEAPCHAPFEQRITVRDGQTTRVRPTLAPICGALSVQSDPPGAAIVINDRPTGELTPHVFTALQPGIATVRLELDGHAMHEGRARIIPRVTRTHRAQLPAMYGFLSVMAQNADGTPCEGPLRIDGERVGRTPWKGRSVARTVTLAVRCLTGTATQRIAVPQNTRKKAQLKVGQGGGSDQCDARLAMCLDTAREDEAAYRKCFARAQECATPDPLANTARQHVWQHADSPRARARAARGMSWSWMPQVDRLRDFQVLQALIWLNAPTDRLRMGLALSGLNVHLTESTPDGFMGVGISFGTQLVGRLRVTGPIGLMGGFGINGGWVPCDNGSSDDVQTPTQVANDARCSESTGDASGEPDIGFAALTTRVLLDVDLGQASVQAGWVRAQYFGGDTLVHFGGQNGLSMGMRYDF